MGCRSNFTSNSSVGILRVGRKCSVSLLTAPLELVRWLVALTQRSSDEYWSSLSTSSRSPRLQDRYMGSSRQSVFVSVWYTFLWHTCTRLNVIYSCHITCRCVCLSSLLYIVCYKSAPDLLASCRASAYFERCLSPARFVSISSVISSASVDFRTYSPLTVARLTDWLLPLDRFLNIRVLCLWFV